MRIFRRFRVAALVTALALAAVGCSSETKIGAVISLTGAVGPYGQQVTRGLDLALEEINAAGGVNGAPLLLIYRDDETNPAKGREVTLDLINNEGIDLIIGAISSTVTVEIAPICEKERVLLLSPTSSTPEISEAGQYIFRNYPSDILEGTAMADFARELGVRRAVIVAIDSEFGAGLTQVFSRRFQSKSRRVLETFRIPVDQVDNFDELISDIKQLNPEAIYLVAYLDAMGSLLKQFREAGIESLVMGSGAVTGQLAQLAGDAADNLVYAQPSFNPDSEEPPVAAFVEAFRAKYSREPDIYAAHGYDSLKLIVQSIINVGQTFPDEVKRGLLGLKDYHGAAGRTQFDERGDVVRYPTIFVIQDGHAVDYEKFEQAGGELRLPGGI